MRLHAHATVGSFSWCSWGLSPVYLHGNSRWCCGNTSSRNISSQVSRCPRLYYAPDDDKRLRRRLRFVVYYYYYYYCASVTPYTRIITLLYSLPKINGVQSKWSHTFPKLNGLYNILFLVFSFRNPTLPQLNSHRIDWYISNR